MTSQEQPATKTKKSKQGIVVLTVVLALLLGAVSAVVVWLFVFAMSLSYELIWLTLPSVLMLPFLPVLICAVGGLLIGLWEKYVWPPAMLLEQSVEIIAKEKRFPYKGMPKTIVSSFLPLAFGGSIGPEAGLVNIIAGLCTWVGDKLKRVGVASSALAEAGLAATMTAVFGTPIAGFVAPVEARFEAEKKEEERVASKAEQKGVPGSTTPEHAAVAASAPTAVESTKAASNSSAVAPVTTNTIAVASVVTDTSVEALSKKSKMLLYIAAIVGGLGVMLTLNHYLGGGLGLPRFEQATWSPGDILISIPLALIGVAGGYLFHVANLFTEKLAARLDNYTVIRTILGGVILGLVGSLLPFTMFSGEEQMSELMQTFTTIGAGVLIATGLAKLCITPLCVNMGWKGGNIFPVVFCGVSLGYGIALITGLDATFCITVLASSLSAAVMRKPVLAIAVLLLCFPVANIIFIAIAAFIGGAIPLPKVLQTQVEKMAEAQKEKKKNPKEEKKQEKEKEEKTK